MSEGPNPDLLFLPDFHHPPHEGGDHIPGHHHVAFIHGRGGTFDGFQEGCPGVPDAFLPLVRVRQQHILCAQAQHQVRQRVHRRLQRLRAGAVQPNQQVRICAGIRKLLSQVGFRAGDHLPLHEFHCGGIASAGQHLRHRADAGVQIVERHQQGKVRLRFRNQLYRQPRQEAQRALRSDHQVDQAVSGGGFHRLSPQFDQTSVRQRNLHAQHIVPGHAVSNRAHAARVGHGVSAHGGGLLSGIRGIEQPGTLQRLGKFHQQHARLHRGRHVSRVHLQDALHFFRGQHDSAVNRHASAA